MLEDFQYYDLKNFQFEQLRLSSELLKGNPLGDPHERVHPLMVPKKFSGAQLPMVWVLAGFTGNAPHYLGSRSFADSFPQQIDKAVSRGKAPRALYVFVDAFSFWGGSQFLNSPATGAYENFLVDELYPALIEQFPIDPRRVLVMGGSSGGYGALHFASKYPQLFPYTAAISPDAGFETCYLADLYKASPFLADKSYAQLIDLHRQGKIHSRRSDGHSILNSIGMAACYSPRSRRQIDFPLDLHTGEIKKNIWKQWLLQDPVHFFSARSKALKKVRGLFLEVGQADQFHLYFGARRLQQIAKSLRLKMHYHEFAGNHFDLSERRPHVLDWVQQKWS